MGSQLLLPTQVQAKGRPGRAGGRPLVPGGEQGGGSPSNSLRSYEYFP